MSFENIGPYELTRSDMIAASLVVSFLTGATRVRLIAGFILLGCLMIFFGGLALEELLTAGIGIIFALLIFVIVPAFRTRKHNKDIYLSHSPEGLVVETANVKTVFKWATIRTVKKVGSRLFVMISDSHALVISDRSTSRDNMEGLIATVMQNQHGAKA